MNAINNSNIEKIYLEEENIDIDISKLDKDIEILTDKEYIDSYREKYRKYDYLFIPKINDDEYYVCFNGTNLPVYIFNKEEILEEPDSSSLPSKIDGKNILYDGYFVNDTEIEFPYKVSENTKISCNYSFIYNINYDYSGVDDIYNLPNKYYDKLGEINLPNLELDGYQFKGWYSIDNYGNYTKKYEKLDKNIDEDINLKAKFLKEFNLTYDKILDDSTLDSDITITYTEEDTISFVTPYMEGFIFDGWYLDSNYSVKASTYIKSDTTVYAKWIVNNEINTSDDINKTFDNSYENISVEFESSINNLNIEYYWYDFDNNLITRNNNFDVINASDSNKYYAIIKTNYNDLILNEFKTDYVNVLIKKAEYDMSNVTLDDIEITYDGKYHTPIINGILPIGLDNIQITSSFEVGLKDVGEKEIICNFNTISENYEAPSSLKANVKVIERIVSIEWSNIKEFEYDGNIKMPEFNLINIIDADKDYIKAITSGGANAVGLHEFKILSLQSKDNISQNYKNYKLTNDLSNTTIEYEIKSKINSIDGISVSPASYVYDGLVHYPNVIIEDSNIRPIYSLSPINVGTYNIKINFEYINNQNEEISNEYNTTLTILQRELELEWDFKEITFDNEIHIPTYNVINLVNSDEIELNYNSIPSKDAGTYVIEFISILGINKDNYKLPSNYEYKILPKTIIIDLDNIGFNDLKTTYNGKPQYPLAEIDNDLISKGVVAQYSGYGKDAKEYDVKVEFQTNSRNYVISDSTKSKTIKVEIQAITAEIKWGQTSFTYDGTIHLPSASINNLISGDQCEVYVTYEGDIEPIVVGEYNALAYGLSNNNYKLADSSFNKTTFNIVEKDYDFDYVFKDIIVEYDGLYHKPIVEILSDENLDWLEINYDSEGIKNVGSMEVIATFKSNNPLYKVPKDSITAMVTITAKEAEIEFILEDNIYNGNAIYPIAKVKNAIGDDDPKVILNSGENNINAGNYVISAIYISNDNNYQISNPVIYSYQIQKATYDISNLKFENEIVEYDGYPHRPSISAIDDSLGTTIIGHDGIIVTFNYSDGLTNVGSKQVTATFVVSENYNSITPMTASITITQREVEINWTVKTYTYTGQIIKPECILSGLVLNDTCDYTINAQGINVGTYEATVTNLTNPNYKLPTNNKFEYSITKANIDLGDLRFAQSSKTYDGTPLYPNVLGTIPSNVELQYEGLSSDSGTHTIVIKFIVSANYNDINPINVDVTITKRIVHINWIDLDIPYTGNIEKPEYELINVLNNDECDLRLSGLSSLVGEHEITILGLTNDNYELDSIENVIYTITKSEYNMSNVKFENVEKVYSGNMQRPEISGTLPAGVSVTYSGGATNVDDGIVTVTATFKSQDDNYATPKPMKATIKIIAKELNISWLNALTFTYDGLKHIPTANITGLLNSDTCNLIYSEAQINAGIYIASILGTTNNNYSANSSCEYEILKANYDMKNIKYENQSYVYNGNNIEHLINGDLLEVVGLDGTSPQINNYSETYKNVGIYTYKVTFKSISPNYNDPADLESIVTITPIMIDLNIKMDTKDTLAWVNNNNYKYELSYDGISHSFIANYDSANIYGTDIVEFNIIGEVLGVNGGNAYILDIESTNDNYIPTYNKLYVTVSPIYAGYWWNNTTASWWGMNGLDADSLTDDIVKIYTNVDFDGIIFENEYPTVYGKYNIRYESISNNIIINNPSTSTSTISVSITNEEIIEFVKKGSDVVSTKDYCQVDGNLKSVISSKTYFEYVFETALKMESSTSISINLENLKYNNIIIVTDTNSGYIKINDVTYKTDNDGILILNDIEDITNITKVSTLNIYGIILI